ncbi:hypothetical protein TYRP_002586 [Tyrophagus putrescentiae]|nr:hypothetical protein TYRP_002586 [Tyrophagus putrescentiae]
MIMTMMMIRRQSLPNGNVRLWLAFVCAAFVFVLPVRQAAPLFPSAYLYDQGGHSGYDGGGGGGGGGIFGKQFFMNGRHHQHQSPAVHYQEFDPPAQTLHLAPPPPVQYEWQEDNGPRVHSGGGSGDDYAEEDYRALPMDREQCTATKMEAITMEAGGEMLKYFSDHELLPSDQHYYDNSNSGGMEHVQENVPITVLYKTLSSPFNQHQQQHIFDLNGDHYEGGGGGSGGDHFPHYIHRVTKPVIAEIHEIITPLRKGDGGGGVHEQTSIQVKDDYHMRPIPLPPPPMSPKIHHLLQSHHHPQSHLQSPAHHLTSSSSPHYQQTDRKLPPSHSNNNKHSFSASEVSFSSHPSPSFSSSSSSHFPRFNYSLMKGP